MLLLIFLLLTAVSAGLVAVMARVGVLDHPGPRSSHARPIPKGGGVGILAASLAGLAILHGPAPERLALSIGGLIVAAAGYWDDRHSFPPLVKFAAQLLAALIAAGFGIIPNVTGLTAPDAAIAVAWILLVTNAVNFMDGLNGLSAGVTAIAAAECGLPWLTLGLLAGIVGFLPFNYPRARIFMGDVGSQFCGYVVAVLAILGADAPHPLVVPFALAGLLFDVIFTLIRRALARDKLTQAHRSHLYQIAHRTGVPDWLVSAIHWAFAAWGVAWGFAPRSPWVVLAVLAPQIGWAIYVIGRARRVPLGKW